MGSLAFYSNWEQSLPQSAEFLREQNSSLVPSVLHLATGRSLHEFPTFPLQFEPLKQLQHYCLFFFPFFNSTSNLQTPPNGSCWFCCPTLPYSALVTLKLEV